MRRVSVVYHSVRAGLNAYKGMRRGVRREWHCRVDFSRGWRVQTVEDLCKRRVTDGIEVALDGMKRETPSGACLLR